jgi:hypothetical protein
MEQFAKLGDFCPNKACPDFQKIQALQAKRNIINTGTKKKACRDMNIKRVGSRLQRHLSLHSNWLRYFEFLIEKELK